MIDVNQIVLCRVCAENPMTKDQESIAAGNNYGQLGSLKPLNGTTWNACVPVQLYNIDLQIQANHSTKHSIEFPMNGPVECLKKLPCLDEKYHPQVTFLGPRDEWMKRLANISILLKWIQILLMVGYLFGSMQITQVSKIASLIPLPLFVMD